MAPPRITFSRSSVAALSRAIDGTCARRDGGKFYLVVFMSVLVAELGDKTQIATLLFAANPEAGKLGVFLAAGLGFVAVGVWVLLT